jgi:hypothetical protein
MLTNKVLVFNKLRKLSFFYRIKKVYTLGINFIGRHADCLLFNIDKFLYFMHRLIPFFLNIVRKQGVVFFVGVHFILLN